MIWQTLQWQEFLKSSKQTQDFFELEGMYIEKRSLGLGQYGLFAMGVSHKISANLWQKLQDLCIQESCLFVQIEYIHYTGLCPEDGGKQYYKKFIEPYTALIDLQKSEDEILSSMKQKGRYNIRLAKKKSVTILQSNDVSIFHELMKETTARDAFAGNTLEYYQKFLQQVPGAQLLLAQYEGQVIAGGLFVFNKDVSLYYYGASSNTHRNLMAPYLLQWEAIKLAKQIGSKLYDFLGVAAPDDTNSHLVGVTDFKKKLTSDIRYVSSSEIWISSKIRYHIFQLLRCVKAFIL